MCLRLATVVNLVSTLPVVVTYDPRVVLKVDSKSFRLRS